MEPKKKGNPRLKDHQVNVRINGELRKRAIILANHACVTLSEFMRIALAEKVIVEEERAGTYILNINRDSRLSNLLGRKPYE